MFWQKLGGNIGSRSSGSKRSHENSVGSSARPMNREAAKKKEARTLSWRRWKRSGLNSKN
ncbi:hypothetical protein MTR_8g065640 [Medicago truncatula]|uniref:Uncharacterized protein n=1 Tax=Medicago truncatula TaxID=3880 RepID=G7LG65_MEDTR|nr:hypothetical protein MTR_8g065640 [Medicago truncatula]